MDEDTRLPSERPSPWWRKRTTLIVAALALVLLLSAGAYLEWRARRDSPRAALTALASSAMNGDADSVAASIDTTAIVDSAVDEILSDDSRRVAMIASYLKNHPTATKEQIKTKARATVDEEIREHVKSGTLPKRIPIGSSSLKALVAKAVAQRSVRSVKVEGDVAHVVVTVPFNHRTVTVKVRMRRSGSGWKVDRIENLAAAMKQAGY